MPNARPTQLQGITDLTLFADIKPGLIGGIFDSRSYTWRAQRVLELLDAARRGYRESDPMPNPFIDGVARLRGVHFFRFSIVPQETRIVPEMGKITPEEGRNRVFLNVTFDGGWEPYIRQIWGQLGTMLDLIFCHCEGYPLAAASSHDFYLRWVRDHEVPSQFFYADSGGTVGDRTYLNRLEALQRAAGERPGADLRAAQLALENPQPPQPTPAAVMGALRTLKGLYGLTQFFGMPQPRGPDSPEVPLDDGSVLLRFAQDFLPDLRDWFARGLFDPGQQFDTLRAQFERERMWLMSQRWTRPGKKDRAQPLKEESLQAGILDSPKAPPGRYMRGAFVLARVKDAGKAREWLAAGAANGLISNGSTKALVDGQVVCSVAITYQGLQALGMRERQLAALPAEFTQGMEARAGILGDVRINHPLQWNRPRAWKKEKDPRRAPIDLPLVHLVIQLRTSDPDKEAKTDRSTLFPLLEQWIEKLEQYGAIEVLAVEPGSSPPSREGERAARDHFGYVDGVSQPVLNQSASAAFWDDAVKTGEVLLGWVNDRGDGPLARPDAGLAPALPAWLDLGTFLVVRKIRQYVDRFAGVVDKAAGALADAGGALSVEQAKELVRAKLMGRNTDGSPLVTQRGPDPGHNDFDFRSDADGAECPFASHVRRANPRTAAAGGRPPRIMRRGMGYSHENERGVLFMAYNASIAEQFEVIQRWLTGGNSSGVSSSQPDPILGVPRVGEPAVFRFTHGDRVVRVDLGDQAICKLEWGLYAFVPSMALLQGLEALIKEPDAPRPMEGLPAAATPESIKRWVKAEFEDDLRRGAGWARVRREHSGVQKIGSTVMVGSYDAVARVLADSGATYSVSGYSRQMNATLGGSPFGQDNDGANPGHQRAFVADVKQSIAKAVSEEAAYATAFSITKNYLAGQLADAKAKGFPGTGVDIIEAGAALIAGLCRAWFGVVYDGVVADVGGIVPADKPVRCPGHFLSVARNVFSAYPNGTVDALARRHGEALKAAVVKWVEAPTATSAPVTKAVLDAMDKASPGEKIEADEKNGTLANVMLGLPATLLGSWGKLLRAWIVDRRLWRFQHDLSPSADGSVAYADARKVLRDALIATMAADPVADGIWRTVARDAELQGVPVKEKDVVWLGLGAALAEKADLHVAANLQAAEDLLFGGTWNTGSDRDTPHACPGRGLAVGALLGALAAFLVAGQWAPTASPTTLSLRPPA